MLVNVKIGRISIRFNRFFISYYYFLAFLLMITWVLWLKRKNSRCGKITDFYLWNMYNYLLTAYVWEELCSWFTTSLLVVKVQQAGLIFSPKLSRSWAADIRPLGFSSSLSIPPDRLKKVVHIVSQGLMGSSLVLPSIFLHFVQNSLHLLVSFTESMRKTQEPEPRGAVAELSRDGSWEDEVINLNGPPWTGNQDLFSALTRY